MTNNKTVYPCPHCERTFTYKNWLGRHIQARHPGQAVAAPVLRTLKPHEKDLFDELEPDHARQLLREAMTEVHRLRRSDLSDELCFCPRCGYHLNAVVNVMRVARNVTGGGQ
jgi:uncharacterized C2H2 Zn-finger protein